MAFVVESAKPFMRSRWVSNEFLCDNFATSQSEKLHVEGHRMNSSAFPISLFADLLDWLKLVVLCIPCFTEGNCSCSVVWDGFLMLCDLPRSFAMSANVILWHFPRPCDLGADVSDFSFVLNIAVLSWTTPPLCVRLSWPTKAFLGSSSSTSYAVFRRNVNFSKRIGVSGSFRNSVWSLSFMFATARNSLLCFACLIVL